MGQGRLPRDACRARCHQARHSVMAGVFSVASHGAFCPALARFAGCAVALVSRMRRAKAERLHVRSRPLRIVEPSLWVKYTGTPHGSHQATEECWTDDWPVPVLSMWPVPADRKHRPGSGMPSGDVIEGRALCPAPLSRTLKGRVRVAVHQGRWQKEGGRAIAGKPAFWASRLLEWGPCIRTQPAAYGDAASRPRGLVQKMIL